MDRGGDQQRRDIGPKVRLPLPPKVIRQPFHEIYDKQYKIETNRFINPGEDWTPEVPKPVTLKPASTQI